MPEENKNEEKPQPPPQPQPIRPRTPMPPQMPAGRLPASPPPIPDMKVEYQQPQPIRPFSQLPPQMPPQTPPPQAQPPSFVTIKGVCSECDKPCFAIVDRRIMQSIIVQLVQNAQPSFSMLCCEQCACKAENRMKIKRAILPSIPKEDKPAPKVEEKPERPKE